MAAKMVRFDYFQIYGIGYDKRHNAQYEDKFNIQGILEKASKIDAADRTYEYGNEDSRLHLVEVLKPINKTDNIWGMQFIRVRKNDRPGILKDDGSFDYMELADNEYIGEEVAALYDSELCVILIQRNKYSLSPTGIQTFFDSAWEENEIFFKPVITPEVFNLLKKKKNYRSIHIKFANLRRHQVEEGKTLFGIAKTINDFLPINADFNLTMGNNRSLDGLPEEEVLQAIELYKDEKEVTKLEVKVLEDDGRVNAYDLIEDRVHDNKSFTYSREALIDYKRVIDSMLATYLLRRPDLQIMFK
jgi:hypothetical protein